MLGAFKNKLKLLARDPQDPFTDRIRKLVGSREAVFYEDPLRRMILAIPEMITQIRTWTDVAGPPSPLRRLHEFALAYLYNPTDFLPEKNHGLFGYVDDAYLVACVYDRTTHETEWAGIKPYTESPVLDRDVPTWLEITRRLLPKVTSKIDDMLDKLTEPRQPREFRGQSTTAPTRAGQRSVRARTIR